MFKIKRLLPSIQGLVLAVAFAGTAGAATYSDDKAQILQIEQNMADVPTAAEALKYFDPNIVLDDLTPGRVQGKKAVATLITAQFAAIKNTKVKILAMSVITDGDLAYAYSLQTIWFTPVQSNAEMATTYRQVDCYHHVNGKWLIVYQQLSVPMDPMTGKAVTDAK